MSAAPAKNRVGVVGALALVVAVLSGGCAYGARDDAAEDNRKAERQKADSPPNAIGLPRYKPSHP